MINLKSLNPSQKKAVEYDNGPSMIVAGAGSGKTKVLTYKVAFLIDQGYKPDTILALTFTNKAASEMKERIKELVGSKADSIWMGTFHSIFAKILRIESKNINYGSNFSIYDAEDSKSLVTNIISDFDLNIESLTPNGVKHKISFLKNHMIMPDQFRKNISSPLEEKIADIFDEYQRIQK